LIYYITWHLLLHSTLHYITDLYICMSKSQMTNTTKQMVSMRTRWLKVITKLPNSEQSYKRNTNGNCLQICISQYGLTKMQCDKKIVYMCYNWYFQLMTN
jgi:hypothetical protein